MDTRVAFRRGTPDDSRACHEILYEAVTAYERDHGTPLEGTEPEWWSFQEPFYGYLAVDAADWWVAQDGEAGALLGYARTIDTGGLLELTEFFVRPGHQSKGLGRELIARAFPAGRGSTRCIIATRDVRALTRYYRTGLAVRFPFFELKGPARPTESPRALEAARVDGVAHAGPLQEADRELLGFARAPAQLACLLDAREAYVYRRDGAVVGFAFVSATGAGPLGALDPADLPGILLHVEGRTHALGSPELELQVPGPNDTAVRHLLSRGFQFSPDPNFLLSDRDFGRFDRLVPFSPPLFL
jgi:GNAT superfamily N-acetyltransferase